MGIVAVPCPRGAGERSAARLIACATHPGLRDAAAVDRLVPSVETLDPDGPFGADDGAALLLTDRRLDTDHPFHDRIKAVILPLRDPRAPVLAGLRAAGIGEALAAAAWLRDRDPWIRETFEMLTSWRDAALPRLRLTLDLLPGRWAEMVGQVRRFQGLPPLPAGAVPAAPAIARMASTSTDPALGLAPADSFLPTVNVGTTDPRERARREAVGAHVDLYHREALRGLELPKGGLEPGARQVGETSVHFVADDLAHPVTLVFLHGAGGPVQEFDRATVHAIGRFGVLMPRLPGFGGTQVPSGSLDVSTLAALLEGLFTELELGRVAIVAESLGALIATEFAHRWPERVSGLLLGDPPLSLEGNTTLSDTLHRHRHGRNALGRAIDGYARDVFGMDGNPPDHLARLARLAALPFPTRVATGTTREGDPIPRFDFPCTLRPDEIDALTAADGPPIAVVDGAGHFVLRYHDHELLPPFLDALRV